MKYDRRAIMNNAWTIRRESGCTMSAALKKAWAVAKKGNEMEELRVAEMTGSAKQIAWATDIITEPYNTVVKLAETNADKFAATPLVEFGRRATIYREAAEMYCAEYNKAAAQLTKASDIIAKRDGFKGSMNAIIHTVAVKHGFTPTDIYRI